MIRYVILLLALWGGSHFSCLFASPMLAVGSGDISYRDSLLREISLRGSVETGCYLSFPIGESSINPFFGNNASELASLRRFLHYALEDSLLGVRRIFITGYSSVDGSALQNERLSLDRARNLYRYLTGVCGLSPDYPVEIKSVGADWAKLRALIADSFYPWRSDALRIIDSAYSPDWKKLQLGNLGGGDAHYRMYNELYPLLRRVEVKITYDLFSMQRKSMRLAASHASGRADTLFVYVMNKTDGKEAARAAENVTETTGAGRADTLATAQALQRRKKKVSREKAENKASSPLWPLVAIKTNLLFDLALAPNLELEVPLGQRWSLNGEFLFPWWLIDGHKYCFQSLAGGLEARLWLGNRTARSPLRGHFAGLYAEGGMYDLQWKKRGYQGDYFVTAGVSYGYSMPLGRHWNLEFSLGVGALYTPYRRYDASDDYRTLYWQKDGSYTWIGPTKAKISLVWLIGNKKGGKR